MHRISITVVALSLIGFPLSLPAMQPTTQSAGEERPIYQLAEREVHTLLPRMQQAYPELRQRIVAIARRNLNQPYQIYLLGESPFETIDPEPVYCLHHSDCVVFAEHTLAMAMSDSWPAFLKMLQRIRYKDGQISVLTRNHYTEADWNRNNTWLVRDITSEIGSGLTVAYEEKIDRAKFFRNRYKLETQHPVQDFTDEYIPYEQIAQVKGKLRDGDVVNFVSGTSASKCYVGHVGLVALAPDGSPNLIHSAAPAVREEPIDQYIARATQGAAEKDSAGRARFRGFKFLRVAEDPMKNLRAIDGPSAPRIWLPASSPVTFEGYIRSFDLAP